MSEAHELVDPTTPSRLPALPTATRYAQQLERDNSHLVAYSTTPSVSLVPQDDLRKILKEIDLSLIPAPAKRGQATAALILGPFRKSDVNDPSVYLGALLKELSRYSIDVHHELIGRIHRGCRFCPSIAEVVELADAIVAERKIVRIWAERQLREHDMRARQRSRGSVS